MWICVLNGLILFDPLHTFIVDLNVIRFSLIVVPRR